VIAWRQFARANLSAHNALVKTENDNGLSERDKSIIEKNRLDTQIKAFELDLKMGEYIPRVTANQEVLTCNTMVVREIDRAIESELPPRLEGLSALAIWQELLAKIANK